MTTKRIALKLVLTVVGLAGVIAALAGTKISQFTAMSAQAADMKPPPATVAITPVKVDAWQPVVEALGSVVAVRGVAMRTEVAGTVRKIYFESGAQVKAGDLLVMLDAATEQAQLQSAQASAALGRSSLSRIESLRGNAAVAESDVEGADARAKQANAEVSRLNAEIDKRAIRAPFDGYLGIWQFNAGQFLGVGDLINSVLSLDPVHVDFSVPESQLAQLRTGLEVRVTTDAYPDETFTGELTAVSPGLDAETRSVLARATLKNPEAHLRPGMFAHVRVIQPEARRVLIIPQSAVLYAPYGDSVFIVEDEKPSDEKQEKTEAAAKSTDKSTDKTADKSSGKPGKVVRQAFVRLGERRGDFVEITKGLDQTDTIVMTGGFKLRNGMGVVINNELKPETSLAPKLSDD